MTSYRARYKQIVDQLQRRKYRTKAQVRSKVEHIFRVMKRQFGFDRVRYRSLAKNVNRFLACLALVNLYLARKRPVPLAVCVRSTLRQGAAKQTKQNQADCTTLKPKDHPQSKSGTENLGLISRSLG
jgi:hypothetical protein